MVRIGFGFIQTITSIALLIILSILKLFGKCQETYSRAWTHFNHGSANLFSSLLECIPDVESFIILYFRRDSSKWL
jgi:hypothetical protein